MQTDEQIVEKRYKISNEFNVWVSEYEKSNLILLPAMVVVTAFVSLSLYHEIESVVLLVFVQIVLLILGFLTVYLGLVLQAKTVSNIISEVTIIQKEMYVKTFKLKIQPLVNIPSKSLQIKQDSIRFKKANFRLKQKDFLPEQVWELEIGGEKYYLFEEFFEDELSEFFSLTSNGSNDN